MDILGQFERHLILLWGTLTRHRRCLGKYFTIYPSSSLVRCGMIKRSNADQYMCDSQASIVGRRIGRLRWCTVFGKTVEGSIAFFLSVLGASWIMWAFGVVDNFNVRSSHLFFFSFPSPKTRGRTEKLICPFSRSLPIISTLFFTCSSNHTQSLLVCQPFWKPSPPRTII